MGLFDSILSSVSGKGDASGGANALMGILGGLLTQSGGLQGLANKFSQGRGRRVLIVGRHGRKPADFRRPNSKGAWFRPSWCTRDKNGSGSHSSLALPG
jgi:hypothetical protein